MPYFYSIFAINIVSVICNLIRQLLWVPLFIASVGANDYSDWVFVFSLVSCHEILALGIHKYFYNQLQIEQNRDKKQSLLLKNLSLAIMPIVVLWLCLGFVFLYVATKVGLLKIELLALASILYLGNVVSIIGGYLLGYFKAVQKQHIALLIRVGFFLVVTLIVALSLYYKADLMQVAYTLLAFYILEIIAMIIKGKALQLLPTGFYFNLKLARNIVLKSISFIVPVLAFYAKNLLPLAVISAIAGNIALLTFNLNRVLLLILQTPFIMLANSLHSDVVRAYSNNNHQKLAKLFETLQILVFLGTISCFIIFSYCYPYILEIWVEDIHKQIFNYNILLLIFAIIVGHSLWYCTSDILWATNRHNKLNAIIFIYTLVLVTFCYYCQLDTANINVTEFLVGLVAIEWLAVISIIIYITNILNYKFLKLAKLYASFSLSITLLFVAFTLLPADINPIYLHITLLIVFFIAQFHNIIKIYDIFFIAYTKK